MSSEEDVAVTYVLEPLNKVLFVMKAAVAAARKENDEKTEERTSDRHNGAVDVGHNGEIIIFDVRIYLF